MNLKWYLNRLKTMSLGEMLFRAEQISYRKYSKFRYIGFWPSVPLEQEPKKLLEITDETVQSMDLDDSSNFKILGLNWDYSVNHDWHLDIRSGGTYPKIFCRDVNTRSDEHGIAKYVWEPNRHQFLTRICFQYRKSKDVKWLKLFMSHLQSWAQENPYLIGVNWYSNIEVNIRLINWFLCWEILDANSLRKEHSEFNQFVEETFVPLIYLHSKYSHSYPSKYSSANNHRISEGVGLFIASTYWKFKESDKWNASARNIVEEEMLAQHTSEGINREETTEYIQFIIDYFLITKVVADASGKPLSQAYDEMLLKTIRYVYQLMDISNSINHYGDADNGRTFILEENHHDFNNFQSLLVTGAMLHQDDELRSKSGDWDVKNNILFGKEGKKRFDKLNPIAVNRNTKFYKDHGRYIFRKETDTQEILFNFDAAPLGFLSIAAHGHADALSFSLTVDGSPVIVDTGTFSYHTDIKWRNYFKGTLAHNTIRVNGMDQAQIGGPTMWKEHYECSTLKAEQNDDLEVVTASHNGYRQIGVMHSRTVEFHRSKDSIMIEDLIESKDDVSIEVPLHLHPEIQVEQLDEHTYLLSRQNMRSVKLQLDTRFNLDRFKGSEEPILGWFSPDFYIKQETESLLQSANVTGSNSFKTIITIEH